MAIKIVAFNDLKLQGTSETKIFKCFLLCSLVSTIKSSQVEPRGAGEMFYAIGLYHFDVVSILSIYKSIENVKLPPFLASFSGKLKVVKKHHSIF